MYITHTHTCLSISKISFMCWWTIRLIPIPCYSKYSSNKHRVTNTSMVGCGTPWVRVQSEVGGSHSSYILIFEASLNFHDDCIVLYHTSNEFLFLHILCDIGCHISWWQPFWLGRGGIPKEFDLQFHNDYGCWMLSNSCWLFIFLSFFWKLFNHLPNFLIGSFIFLLFNLCNSSQILDANSLSVAGKDFSSNLWVIYLLCWLFPLLYINWEHFLSF